MVALDTNNNTECFCQPGTTWDTATVPAITNLTQETRDCSSPPRPGNNNQLNSTHWGCCQSGDCTKTFWRQDANNNWYEHKSNYWTFKISFDWHQCSASKEKNSFYNLDTESSLRFGDSQRDGSGGKDFNSEEEGFVIIAREYLSRGYWGVT